MTDMDSGAQGSRTQTQGETMKRCEEDENDEEESIINDRQQKMTHEREGMIKGRTKGKN